MADTEQFFNVKNVSLRAVGFAGKLLAPNDVIKVLDDVKKINHKTIKGDPFLDFTDEEPTIEGDFDISLVPKQVELQEVEKQTGEVAPAGTKAKKAETVKTEGGKATATGAKWGGAK